MVVGSLAKVAGQAEPAPSTSYLTLDHNFQLAPAEVASP
jgi:hypothetical protein